MAEPLGPEYRAGIIVATILLGRKLHEMKRRRSVDQMAWVQRVVHPILADLLDPPVQDWSAAEDDLVSRGIIPPDGPDPFIGHVDERGGITVTRSPEAGGVAQ